MSLFSKLPQVLSAEKILDQAFKNAKNIQIQDRDPFYRRRKIIIKKTEVFAGTIITTLEKYVKGFPSVEQLPPFYQELLDIRVDRNQFKKSLGAVDWARKTCMDIYNKQSGLLERTGKIDFLTLKQKEIYGRISSVVKQIDSNLLMLAAAQKTLRQFPDIQDVPTVVIAGYPNVGKSSLLRCLSRARPLVALYPFTTKEIYIGHMEKTVHYVKQLYQVIDTPGLLDRPLSSRNDIEKQAIAALQHLADLIVFILDPSETSGYSIKDQDGLLVQMKKIFPDIPFIIVENKADLMSTDSASLKISCESHAGIDELKKMIFKMIEQQNSS